MDVRLLLARQKLDAALEQATVAIAHLKYVLEDDKIDTNGNVDAVVRAAESTGRRLRAETAAMYGKPALDSVDESVADQLSSAALGIERLARRIRFHALGVAEDEQDRNSMQLPMGWEGGAGPRIAEFLEQHGTRGVRVVATN